MSKGGLEDVRRDRASGSRTSRLRMLILGAVAIFAAPVALLNMVVLAGTRHAPDAPMPDCAVVLGNGVRDDGTPGTLLTDRLEETLELYRSGKVHQILVSGDAIEGEAVVMRRWLEARGVPSSAILYDDAARDTYTSVWRARHVFGLTRAVIVTQDFHLPRALWLAGRIGLDADGASADRRPYPGNARREAREVLSRVKAFVDVSAHRVPEDLGPPLDHDRRLASRAPAVRALAD